MPETSSYKRRNFMVDPPFQLKIILMIVVLVAMGVGLMAWGLSQAPDFQVSDLPFSRRATRWALVVATIVYVAGTALIALFVSHSVAGPMYRFRRSLQAVAGGDLTHRVYLRNKDEMADLREDFNAMVESIHRRVSADSSSAWKSAKALEELLGSGALPPDITAKLRPIHSDMATIGKGFKLF